jgi:copper transport protein
MKRAAAALASVAVAGALATPALAHPRIATTVPAAGAVVQRPPTVVVVGLNEASEPVGDGISVRGPDGREAARGPVSTRARALSRHVDATQQGSYVVSWTVVGDDSHPARGAFVFSVGRQTKASLGAGRHTGVTLQAIGRLLSLAGFALGFGAPFAALVSGGMTRRLWRLVNGGIVLMLVAEPVSLLGQTATLAPSSIFDPSLAGDILLTQYGHVTGLRLGAAVGLWALAGAVRNSSPRMQWAIPGAGAVVALVQADGAHRIGGVPTGLSIVLEGAHAAAFAAWAGCIVVAVAEGRGRRLAQTAVLSALVLVATGAGLALGQIGSLADLVETGYGATLAVKLGLVAVVLALGAIAWRRAELAVAFTVLAAASLLVSLAPP